MSRTPRNWFRFQNQAADPTVVEIYVVDIIGDWIDEIINEYYGMKATLTAKGFLDQLSRLDAGVKTIRVHVNSPGGDVFAALNIANALRDQQATKGRTVETIVDGLAASAASIIAMAGKTVTMADNALMMIHQPWSVEVGNATNFRAAADTLDTISQTIVATYQWHSSLGIDALMALLVGKDGVDGTWMTADEAIANGLATDKREGLTAAASIDRSAVKALKVPDRFRSQIDAFLQPEPPAPVVASATDVLAAVEAAGLGLAFGRELVAAALPMSEVTARVSAEQAKQARATARAKDIRALCVTAKLEELADGYVDGGMSVDAVRAHLVTIKAKASPAIDSALPADSTLAPKVDVMSAYAALNARRSH
jgi:ATP-dependent protease ClpP protease subunit